MTDTQAAEAVRNSLKRRYLWEAINATEHLIEYAETPQERRGWTLQHARLVIALDRVKARFLT